MPRDSGGVYSAPSGTLAVSAATISSSPYNAFVSDLEAIANEARPVSAGGTGGSSATAARANLGLVIGTDVLAYNATLAAFAAQGNVEATQIADGDYGDISIAAGVFSIDDDAVGPDQLEDTAVTAGTYAGANITVDAQGRITFAEDGSAGQLTADTPQDTTSGTEWSFTSIPAGVREVVITFSGTSFEDGANIEVQIGDSGGIETTGYYSEALGPSGSTVSTTSFVIDRNNVGDPAHGIMTLVRHNGNQWVSSHAISTFSHGGGSKTLTGELTQLRVFGGTGDEGSVNIHYR